MKLQRGDWMFLVMLIVCIFTLYWVWHLYTTMMACNAVMEQIGNISVCEMCDVLENAKIITTG